MKNIIKKGLFLIILITAFVFGCMIGEYLDHMAEEQRNQELQDTETKGYKKGWNDHMNMTFNVLTNLENDNATILNSSNSSYDSCEVLGLNETVIVVAEKRSNSYRLYAFGISKY